MSSTTVSVDYNRARVQREFLILRNWKFKPYKIELKRFIGIDFVESDKNRHKETARTMYAFDNIQYALYSIFRAV